jgi:hypothetical protein
MSNKYDEQVLKDLADDLRGLVSEIESSVKTTQNHYGRYMGIIQQVAKGDKVAATIIAEALVIAGANKKGVRDAMRVSF